MTNSDDCLGAYGQCDCESASKDSSVPSGQDQFTFVMSFNYFRIMYRKITHGYSERLVFRGPSPVRVPQNCLPETAFKYRASSLWNTPLKH